MLTYDDILIWLNLNLVDSYRTSLIEETFPDLELVFSEESNLQLSSILQPYVYQRILKNRDLDNVKAQLNLLKNKNYGVITYKNEQFPKNLLLIEDTPKVLYYIGDISLFNGNLLAVVGARNISSYGKWACEHIIKQLSEYDISIVSGLALGTDAIAHKSAIDFGLKTIGVLGTGIDMIYPQRNNNLYKKMYESHLVISEFPPGTKGMPQNFPLRNRIISGLSEATIVIEAKLRSGSLITARLAFEQGKEVFALPGNINNINSEGTNELIKDGAYLLTNVDDILDIVNNFKHLKNKATNNSKLVDISSLNDFELEVYNILLQESCTIDRIALQTNISIADLNSILTILEMKGYITEIEGNKFSLI